MKRNEKVKAKMKEFLYPAAWVLGGGAVLLFGFFAMYADLKTPDSGGMSLTDVMNAVYEFRGGVCTIEDLEAARMSLILIVGALFAGMVISAIGMLLAWKYPDNKLVKFLFSEYVEEEKE